METISKMVPEYIVNFAKNLEKLGVNVHSFGLLIDGKTILETYYEPIQKEDLQRVFSISKSFTALGIGLLADEGKISLDDSICKYFKEYVPVSADERLLNCTIKDCLMMRSCHTKTTYDKFDMTSNWVESFFTTPPTKEPGSCFNYDTGAAHVLCALVEKLTGLSLLDYIRKRLPDLGISDEAYMLCDGCGVSMGGSGLVAKLTDLLALGEFLLECLTTSNSDFISDFLKNYIREATSNLSDTSATAKQPFEGFGYGYQIWQGDHAGIVCYGMGGQFIIVHPAQRLVLAITSNNIGDSAKNQLIFDCFYKDILLNLQDNKLVEFKSRSVLSLPYKGNYSDSFFYNRHGLWTLQENSNVRVFTTLAYESKNENESEILLTYSDGTEFRFRFGFGKNCTGIMDKYGMRYCASASVLSPDELTIRMNVIDSSVGWIQFKLKYSDDCGSLLLNMEKHEETLFNEFQGTYKGLNLVL